jgi:hypothetical protein
VAGCTPAWCRHRHGYMGRQARGTRHACEGQGRPKGADMGRARSCALETASSEQKKVSMGSKIVVVYTQGLQQGRRRGKMRVNTHGH